MISAMNETENQTTPEDYDRFRQARYQRLSLLTLDLAEEAGEAAVNFARVDNKGDRPSIFERRIAAMTRVIWAHQAIERMRNGGAPKRDVSRGTHGDSEFNRMRTIDGGVTSAETAKRDEGYYEILRDGPASVHNKEKTECGDAWTDAPLLGAPDLFGAKCPQDGDEINEAAIDEAAIDGAIKRALGEGRRGEDALKAALGFGVSPEKRCRMQSASADVSGPRAPP